MRIMKNATVTITSSVGMLVRIRRVTYALTASSHTRQGGARHRLRGGASRFGSTTTRPCTRPCKDLVGEARQILQPRFDGHGFQLCEIEIAREALQAARRGAAGW